MTLFRNYPLVNYKFGDENTTAIFTNLTAYIDIIDQVKDDGSFYEYYDIIDGDRPDTVSYKLYGTTDYYWTFYLLNENLRTRGWPLTEHELETQAPEYYPHTILTTQEEMFKYFKIGQTVVTINDILSQEEIETSVSEGQFFWNDYDGRGTIIEKNLDLGQITVKADDGLENITITNAGAGYYRSPIITITGGEGAGATASATVDSLGFISEIELISRGSGFISNPIITISDPDLINWNSFKNTLKEYVDNGGSLLDSEYNNLINTNIEGYKLGDINNDRVIDSDDIKIISDYVLNANLISAENKAWIEQIIKPEIITKSSLLGNLFPSGTYEKETATATATRWDPQSTFDNATWMFTEDDTYETDVGLWTTADVRWNAITTSRDQLYAIHHWENDSGEWIDINPFNQSGVSSSTIGKTAVTYFDRLKRNNDELKQIKVFRPGIIEKIYEEFNKVMRNSRNG